MPLVRVSNGGSMSGTELWANPSTSTTWTDTFTAQTITLADNISNYKYIVIRVIGSYADRTNYVDYMFDANDMLNKYTQLSGDSAKGLVPFIGNHWKNGSNNYLVARPFNTVADNQIYFSTAYRLNTTNTMNFVAVPYKVIGMK